MKGKIKKFFESEWGIFVKYYVKYCIIFGLIIHFVFVPAIVSGESMNNTLQNHDVILVEKLKQHYSENDVIVIKKDNLGIYIVKRVIGVPGDRIQIKNGKVYKNGIPDELDTYGITEMQYSGTAEYPITLKEGEYFCLGDNRNHSEDSRYGDVGIIKEDEIVGHAFIKIFPGIKIL